MASPGSSRVSGVPVGDDGGLDDSWRVLADQDVYIEACADAVLTEDSVDLGNIGLGERDLEYVAVGTEDGCARERARSCWRR